MKNSYLEVVFLIERLHRLFLENVKAELEGSKIYDINNTQALILYNIGEERISVGELTQRGYYLGSNVSYNLRKMVINGFLVQEASLHDKRSTIVNLSEKGLKLYKFIDGVMSKHINSLSKEGSCDKLFVDMVSHLKSLENFWAKGKEAFSFR
ncbi:MAG: winged helix DNA-binding protein [Holosporales bacterium]|jgi:DNA-binding MarR family transcriptional regulator|nr:winged helix DNA-binding protein [Holosporales bacterium]